MGRCVRPPLADDQNELLWTTPHACPSISARPVGVGGPPRLSPIISLLLSRVLCFSVSECGWLSQLVFCLLPGAGSVVGRAFTRLIANESRWIDNVTVDGGGGGYPAGADPACRNGIKGWGGVCCAKSCGQCGGTGCQTQPGGAAA